MDQETRKAIERGLAGAVEALKEDYSRHSEHLEHGLPLSERSRRAVARQEREKTSQREIQEAAARMARFREEDEAHAKEQAVLRQPKSKRYCGNGWRTNGGRR